METETESLTEVCAPVFVFLTTFRRNAATSQMGIDALQRALQREIEEARRRCDKDRKLSALWDKAFYPLVAAADQVVLSSDWPQRAGWTMRLLEVHYFKTAEGGKKFFNVVEDVLRDSSEDAPPLAELLFTCMALGFQGELLGETRELERRRRALYEKARLAGKTGDNLAPDAYNKNSARRVLRLPAQGILRTLLIAVAALLVALLLGTALVRLRIGKKLDQMSDVASDLEELDRIEGGRAR